MHLSDHSLRQIDVDYVRSLGADALRDLSLRGLSDLKEARERLHQGPTNSSRPPSSRAPWERGRVLDPTNEPAAPQDEAEEAPLIEAEPTETRPDEVQPSAAKPARKAGKQPGAPGMGRTQVLEARELIPHYPGVCAGCGQPLTAGTDAVAYTGFQAVDLRWGEPGEPGLCKRVAGLWMRNGTSKSPLRPRPRDELLKARGTSCVRHGAALRAAPWLPQ